MLGKHGGRGVQCKRNAKPVDSHDCSHCGHTIDLIAPDICETPVISCPECNKWPTLSIPRGRRFDLFREDIPWRL